MNPVECRCGKRWYPVSSAVLSDEQVERLAAMCLCKSCSADFNKAMDSCPETIGLPHGSSACSLGWAHTGLCQPYAWQDARGAVRAAPDAPPAEDVIRQLRDARPIDDVDALVDRDMTDEERSAFLDALDS